MRSEFTIVPPGPVSDRIRVEIRVGVVNDADASCEAVVEFTCDGRVVGLERVVVPARGHALARVWLSTRDLAGDRVVAYRGRVGDATVEGERVLRVERSATRALPRLTAGWIDPGSFGAKGYARDGSVGPSDLREIVQAMHGIGMSAIVLTYLEYSGATYYPSSIELFDGDVGYVSTPALDWDLPEVVLDESDRLGMHVFLGLGRGGDTTLLWEFEKEGWVERNARGVDHTIAVATELWRRYAHHPSFYGWYLTHEMNDLARASAYYDPVARHCHAFAPEKPVMAAPSGTPIIDRETLAASEVDIFAYQDAVGSGYVPYENTWDPHKRIAMLSEVYSSYASLHEGTDKHLWSDLETWEMDGTHGYSHSYPPAFSRVRGQIELEAPHVDVLSGYEYSGFFQHPGARVSLLDDRARALHDEYQTYLKGL